MTRPLSGVFTREFTRSVGHCLLLLLHPHLHQVCGTPRPAKHDLSRNSEDQFTDRDYDRLNRYVDAIKRLLEAGANPTHYASLAGENGIDFIERRLHEVRIIGDPFIRLVKDRFYRQVIAIMKDSQAFTRAEHAP